MSDYAIASICIAVVFVAVIGHHCFEAWLDAKYGGDDE